MKSAADSGKLITKRATSILAKCFLIAHRILKLVQVDRAVAASLIGRLWTLIAGPITLLMIAYHFSDELQGYYYTFISLLALQSFVELGFSIVIVQFASHEWAKLNLNGAGEISGDTSALSRLSSLTKLVSRWFAVAGGVFAIAVGAGGFAFLSLRATPGVEWEAPWVALVVIGGIQLWLLPFIALLEGCNQIVSVNMFRLAQAIASSFTMWLGLWLDMGLWAVPMSLGIGTLCCAILLCRSYNSFFCQVFRIAVADTISWRSELWPMQWRLACTGVTSYFAFSMFTPVIYWAQGPVEAGKMGMTLSIIGGLQSIAAVWLMTRVPRFGNLIALKQFDELDHLFRRTLLFSLGVLVFACFVVWGMVEALKYSGNEYSDRLLHSLALAVFLFGAILQHVSLCEGFYVLAHKKNPFLVMGVTTNILIGSLVYILGTKYGPIGAGIGSLLVLGGLVLPWQTYIWFRCRRDWHTDLVT